MVPVSTSNPFPIQVVGGGTGGNASVGLNGVTAPTSSTEIGFINSSGNLVGISPSNPLPISGSISATSALNATSTLPTLSSGSQSPQGSLAGASYVQPVFGSATGGGTQVDATHGLPVLLLAGTAIIGKVGIDQTTPGTTNAVDITNLPVTQDVNTGNATNSTVRVVLASNQPTVAISAASLPLPSGAATSALQTTGNTSLGTIASGYGATSATAPTDAVNNGLVAQTGLPTAVTGGQLISAMADKFGRQITRSAPRNLLVKAALSTTGTSGTLLAAQGAGIFADLYSLRIANSSAAAVLVTISDGTVSEGYEVPATSTVGFTVPAGDADPASAANTAWTYTVATGTTTIYITAQFILNQ